MTIYVQLLAARQLDGRAYNRGDWVDVGRQTALRWVADRSAIARGVEKIEIPADCGIVARGGTDDIRDRLSHYGLVASMETIPLGMPVAIHYPRVLVWQDSVRLRVDLIPAGFGFLERWDVAIPLVDHQLLAEDVGGEAERERTRAVLRDLRVPLYNPGVMFVRDCAASRAVLASWQRERLGSADERLALLRALYTVKPLLLALPRTWIE